ncbi:MAG: AMP-binding protein, partial [Acidimicrobiales bacterium]
MTATSFPAALRQVAEADPDAVAVVCVDGGDETTLSRGELDRAGNRMARAYADLGVGEGDMVTIALPNGPEWFVACLATWKLGAVPNLVSPRLPLPERDAIIDRADPALVVGVAADEAAGRTAVPVGFVPERALDDGPLPDRTSPVERALASGGSTGQPKLICSVEPAVFDPASPLAMLTARRAILVTGPTYHGIPYATAWRTVLAGATAVVLAHFDPAECLRLIERHRVDKMTLVPTMMLRIARLPEAERL